MSEQLDELQRRAKVQSVIHSGRLEGREPSPEFEADAELYVRGQMTATELVEKTRASHGLS